MTITTETTPKASHVLTLSDADNAEFLAVAEELVGREPGLVDDQRWVTAARELSCRLPLSVREAIRAYRHDPGEAATLVLRNLPVPVEQLPETPTVPNSVERKATVPAAIAAMIALHIGELSAFRDEKFGALVQNVVPVQGKERSQSNAGSIPLELHVENAFHPNRPDFVGLLCLRSDHERVAGLLVSSIRRALGLLTAETRQVLQEPRFVTSPPPSFTGGGDTTPHAVLTGDFTDPNVQVDFHATQPLGDEAKIALEQLRDAFIEVSETLRLRSGEMAFVDNRIAIHGRTGFEPRYDGQDRWLHRTFVHLDSRRTRVDRAGNGSVLA